MPINIKFKNIDNPDEIKKIKHYLENDRTFKRLSWYIRPLKKKMINCSSFQEFEKICNDYEKDLYPIHTLNDKELEIEASKRITYSAYVQKKSEICLEYAKINTYELQRRQMIKQNQKIDQLIETNKDISKSSKKVAFAAIAISLFTLAHSLFSQYWNKNTINSELEDIKQLISESLTSPLPK